ncbi:MAG: glycoside hydrolase N-terminal domain-containing protein, partial [Bacteroidales bacterium]
MKNIKSFVSLTIGGLLLLFACKQSGLPDRIIWFDRPADYFEEAIPLGNGRLGATLFGGV